MSQSKLCKPAGKLEIPYTVKISEELHKGIAFLSETEAKALRVEVRMLIAKKIHEHNFNPADYGLEGLND